MASRGIEAGMRTLFLDRDGTMNVRLVDDYVKRPEELVLINGVAEAMRIFAQRFDRIFVVTNQQGIGKGLMSEHDLTLIHQQMMAQITAAGGRVDKIYHCPALKEAHSFDRKPSIGMAVKARHDYPGLRLKDCVMVGDTASDMLFGRRAGMTTILVGEEAEIAQKVPHLVDQYHPTLLDFAKTL